MDELTYAEVGATQGVLPFGHQHLESMRTVGRGAGDFYRAAEAVMSWGVHRGAGLRVEAGCERSTQGGTVTVRLGVGPLEVRAPCVVVFTIDEPRRRGFAYGTLSGHPGCREELFLVEHCDDDPVRLTIRAFSRPALWWSRASGPAGRLVQRGITAPPTAGPQHVTAPTLSGCRGTGQRRSHMAPKASSAMRGGGTGSRPSPGVR